MNTPHSLSAHEVASSVATDLERGLFIKDAEKRLIQFGLNSLEENNTSSFLKRLFNQFRDAMVLILIAAAALSAFMAIRENSGAGWIDVVVILLIVIINAFLGVHQEGKADRALAALKRMSSPRSKVIREGAQLNIPSSQLVPGDIVCVEPGDLVAADIRLVWQQSLNVDESSLTGESVPIAKRSDLILDELTSVGDRKNMLFMGTAVTNGKGTGIVTSTGSATELGHIASQLQVMDDDQTPLQKNLTSLGKYLGIICVVVCIIVFTVDVFIQHTPWEESLMIAVSLAVAAIPEGLAAVVTIVLSIGMTKMSSRNAIVRKLLAVETLGCVDVICSDKTGTLTQNEMTVREIFCGGIDYSVVGTGYAPEGQICHNNAGAKLDENNALKMLVLNATLCNDARIDQEDTQRYKCVGDPTEGALLTMSAKAGIFKAEANTKYPRFAELPFDSDRKMMTTYHSGLFENQYVSFTKGAPELILSRCSYYHDGQQVLPMTASIRTELLSKNSILSKKALRVLAFSYSQVSDDTSKNQIPSTLHEDQMIFLGLCGMIDPARPEAKDAINKCKEAGIRAVMITGDHKETALAIAQDLGMISEGEKGLAGFEIDRLTDDELMIACEDVSVYSRVSPDHKVRIVSALKRNDHIVSMTGDGVNDAMALKAADIGVAMGITGTEVAKNSSDMILSDDNFASIVYAIEEGRVIFSNIRKFVSFLLSCNVGEILVIFIISLIPIAFFNQSGTYLATVAPLTAIQLLWLNLVTDSFPALALGREKIEPGIMNQMPRRKSEQIINSNMRWTIIVQSTAIFLSVFIAFVLGLFVLFQDSVLRLEGARTMAFGTLIMAELFRAYSARSERVSVFKMGLFSNIHMNVAVIVSAMLLIAVIYLPGLKTIFKSVALPIQAWIPMILLSMIPFVVGELYKTIRSTIRRKERQSLKEISF